MLHKYKNLISHIALFGLLGTGIAFGGSVSFPLDGGTGTATPPTSGQVLIGNSTNTYTPSFLTAGSNITISTSSGSITIEAVAGSGLTSLNGLTTSTQVFATSTVADTWTITSSGLTHTFTIPSNVGFFSNDSGYLTSSGAVTALNSLTGSILLQGTANQITVASSSGNITLSTPQDIGTASNVQFGTITAGTGLVPDANDGAYLGQSGTAFSDLFLANGGIIDWNAGDVTLTHSTNTLALAGGDLSLGSNNLLLTGSIASTGSRVTKGWFTDLESTNAPTVSGAAVYYTGGTDVAIADGGTGTSTTPTDLQVLTGTGSAYTLKTLTGSTNLTISTSSSAITFTPTGLLVASNNLSDLTSTSSARTNLGLGSIATVNSPVPVGNGGTGLSSLTQGDLLYYNSGTTLTQLAKNTSATRYLANTGASNNPSWDFVNLSNGVTSTLPVANGGTGASTLTSNNVLLGNGTSAVQFVAPGTTGNVLTSNGTTWTSAQNIKTQYFLLENPTTSEDDAFFIFNATSTITKVQAVNKSTGDTATINLVFCPSRATASASCNNVFTSNQAVTATTTAATLSITGSSTPSTGDVMRFITSAASSSQIVVTMNYYEN